MINSNKIKARIVELGFNQQQVAEKLGIDVSSFNQKINSTSPRVFNLTEVEEMITILEIEDPREYFFV